MNINKESLIITIVMATIISLALDYIIPNEKQVIVLLFIIVLQLTWLCMYLTTKK